MIKTIIVDDEYNAREFLEQLLIRYFPDKFLVLAKCESADDAITAIENFNPELVFLDIQMPNKNGFELIKSLKTINFEVIFTTAHSEFGIDAVKASALDYILKPIGYIDLLEAVKKYDSKQNKASQQDRLMLLIENIDFGSSEYHKIALQTETGFEFVKVNSILYCEAESNYTKVVFLEGKKITLSKTLKIVEELLPTNIFKRIHRSYLVNINYVNRFNKTNDYYVELTNGESLPVSVRKKDDFINDIIKKK
ncbi:LytTR family DNA-binding domain-containing protein [uncultured Flavobacterium sp.]|uniref:LytR/AlgR family response regulator transcription factor n=1 Tax=uncultured Flavobacterium sp. TaxID=165435 RepID=UPI0030EF7574